MTEYFIFVMTAYSPQFWVYDNTYFGSRLTVLKYVSRGRKRLSEDVRKIAKHVYAFVYLIPSDVKPPFG